MNNLLTVIAIFITGLLAGIYWPGSNTPVNPSAQAIVAPEVVKIEKEEIEPKKLKVYKPEAKTKH